MTDKSTRWAFTAYEQQYGFFKTMPHFVKRWGWNVEICPNTQREHYQGFILLNQMQRFSFMRRNFPGLHVEIPRNWEALIQYCQKEDTRKEGTSPTDVVNDIPTKFAYAEEIAKRVATQYLFNHTGTALLGPDILTAVEAAVRADISNGRRGVEWIAANPDWKVVWKGYGVEMVTRAVRQIQTDRQTDNELMSPEEYIPDAPSPQSPQEQSSHSPSPVQPEG